MSEPQPLKRKAHQQVRRWSAQYGMLVNEVEAWAGTATDKALAEMLAHCALYGQTNCWYMDLHAVEDFVVPTIKAEQTRRHYAAQEQVT